MDKFPKSQRLRGRKLIGSLFEEGETMIQHPFKIYYHFEKEIHQPIIRFGIAVPKKNVRNACRRNRIKRLVREAFRKSRTDLENFLISDRRRLVIFMIYRGNINPEYSVILNKLMIILKRFQKEHETDSGENLNNGN